MSALKVVDGRTEDGDGDVYQIHHDSMVYCDGTFDGATMTLNFGPTPDGPWFTDEDVTFTDRGFSSSTLTARTYVKGVVSDAGASTDLSVWVG